MTLRLQTVFKLVILFFSFTPKITAVRAPTWDHCNCHWEAWKAWSECSSSCGGGTQNRERWVWVLDVPECDGFKACATDGDGWEKRVCNTNCFNGGTFHRYFTYYGYCNCVPGKRGTCCEQTVDCGRPSTISHGTYTGTDFTYNHKVHYHCDTDFNMTDSSQAIRTCSELGYWTGSSPVCSYANSCSSSPCKNGADCVNMLGDYKCNCMVGWSGRNCEIDVQPPIVSNCPANMNNFTENMTVKYNWTEPAFIDPHNTTLHITKNYQTSSFEFPWGEYTIQYEAIKLSNGLKAECTFNISVKPYPCPMLELPEKGILACNGWRKDYSRVCKIMCQANYTLPYGFNTEDVYVCGATGHWLPASGPLKCVPEVLFPGHNDSKYSCADRAKVAKFYIEALENSAQNALCLDHSDDCKDENVEIKC